MAKLEKLDKNINHLLKNSELGWFLLFIFLKVLLENDFVLMRFISQLLLGDAGKFEFLVNLKKIPQLPFSSQNFNKIFIILYFLGIFWIFRHLPKASSFKCPLSIFSNLFLMTQFGNWENGWLIFRLIHFASHTKSITIRKAWLNHAITD